MASVGSVSCDFVKGVLVDETLRVMTWNVPGLSGVGVHTLGLGEGRFAWRLIKYGSNTDVETWIVAVEALKGTIVTIVDDWATNFENCLVKELGQPRKQAVLDPDDDTVDARAEIRIAGEIV